MLAAMEQSIDAATVTVGTGSPSACPIDRSAGSGGGCPFPHGGVQRSAADMVVRRLLRISERPPHVSEAAAYNTFRRSMAISATRCTLTYVVFPFVLPAVGFATGVGPVIGIVIGLIAMTCDVYTIRRFFQVDHKWRWPVAGIASGVIVLLSILLVQDIAHLVT